ncbi:HAD family hydrolase [Ferroacidibacillus organovorans]|uniref:HAD family hydrolase n=1 Tax=Ferroacidibacillus organovorans TaxID=1765683 RepID=UPI002350849A|nr:HAD hydrolase family protein [Ferroacidibacillus organovorans]
MLLLGYESSNRLAKCFGDDFNVIATDRGMLVQIMHKSASKEAALQRALNEIGVSPEKAMVFGDDHNDLGLFQLCGYPIAMGNAIDELKALAKYVTETNDADGVAVEKLLLSTKHF